MAEPPGPLTLSATLSGELAENPCATLRRFLVEASEPLAALQMRQELAVGGEFVVLEDWQTVTAGSGRLVDVPLWTGRNVVRFRGRTAESDWVDAPAEVVEIDAEPDLIRLRAQETESGFLLRWDALGDPGGDLELLLVPIDSTSAPASVTDLRLAAELERRSVARDAIDVDPTTRLRRFDLLVGRPTSADPTSYALALRAADGCQSAVVLVTRQPAASSVQWIPVHDGSFFAPTDGVGRPWGTRTAPLALDNTDLQSAGAMVGRDGRRDVVVATSAGTVVSYPSGGRQLGIELTSPIGILASTHRVLVAAVDGDVRDDLILVSDQRVDLYRSDATQVGRFDPLASFLPESEPGVVEVFADCGLGDFDMDGVLDLYTALVEIDGRTGEPLGVGYVIGRDRRLSDLTPALQWDTRMRVPAPPAGATDGFHLLVGDLDGDGRDDLLHERRSGTTRTWVAELARDDGVESRSSEPFSDMRDLRWDHSWLGDVDGDGFADLVTLREPSGGIGVVISGYRNDGRGVLEVDESLFDVPTQALTLRHCHLRVCDVFGDGRLDLVLNRTDGSPSGEHGLRVWTGVQDPATGRQDWTRWADGPVLEYQATDRTGAAQFLAEDLNNDGILDFASYGLDLGASTLVVLFSDRATEPRVLQPEVELGLRGVAVANEFEMFQPGAPTGAAGRAGDVFLGVTKRGGGSRVELLSPDIGAGGGPGDFAGVVRWAAAGVDAAVVASVMASRGRGPVRDVYALTEDGAFGEFRFDTGEQRFVWEASGVRFTGEVRLFAADLDGDPFGDCVVWEKITGAGSSLWTFQRSVRDPSGAGPLTVGRRTLSGEVSYVGVLPLVGGSPGMPNDGRDEIVSMFRPYQSSNVEVWVDAPLTDPATGVVSLRPVATRADGGGLLAGRVTDACVLHVGGTAGVVDRGPGDLVLATSEGRLFRIPWEGSRLGAIEALDPAGFAGIGALRLAVADLTDDRVADLLVFDSGSGELRLFTANLASENLRIGVAVATGTFSASPSLRLNGHLPGLWAGRPAPGLPSEVRLQRERDVFGLTAIEQWSVRSTSDAGAVR